MATVISLKSGKEIIVDDFFYHLQNIDGKFHVFTNAPSNRMYQIKDEDIECFDIPMTDANLKAVIDAHNTRIPESDTGANYA